MKNSKRIFLIGPMAAGKTSVGKALSKLLHREFYDADVYLEQLCGISIDSIFKLHGEQYFRNLESNLLDKIQLEDNIVFATGGGFILHHLNRNSLRALGCVIYLKVSVDEQCRRLANLPLRPPLPVEQKQWPGYFTNTMQTRASLYEQTADFSVTTDSQQVNDIVNSIMQKLGVNQ